MLWSPLQLGHTSSVAAVLCVALPCPLLCPCTGLAVGFSQLTL